MNLLERLEEVLGRLRRHHSHEARLTLEEMIMLNTDALVAAANAVRTTCDALVAQGRDDAAAAKAAAEAAVADAEKTAQDAIDASTKTLTDANAELTPLLAPPAPSGSTPPSGDAPAGTAHLPTVDANGNQAEGAPPA